MKNESFESDMPDSTTLPVWRNMAAWSDVPSLRSFRTFVF